MGRIIVEQQIKIYEVNGKETPIGVTRTLRIASHGSWNTFVVLQMDGEEIAVDGDDLKTAIDNAMNTGDR